MSVFNAINSIRYGKEITRNIKERFDKHNTNYLVKKGERIWTPNNKFTNFIFLKNISYEFKNNFDKEFKLNIQNLELKSKGILVISGKSGAGKTTLLNIIARLYKPDSGIIFYNDRVINPSKDIAYVSQNIKLLDSTIISNVAFGLKENRSIENKVIHSLTQAGIINKINTLENNIHTTVGENGNKFSGGERQRIILARALFRKPKLLILDEPTSSLDDEIANAFITVLEKLSKEISIVLVTHKISNRLREISEIFNINN